MNVNSLSASPPFPAAVSAQLRLAYEKYADAFWMVALAIIALWYALQYNIILQVVPHDTTFHIYAAQQILEGHPIYRDVAIIKAPLADFVTAFALLVSRALRISDVMGARLMSLCIAVATTGVTYLAGRVLFRSRAAGVLAGLIMAGWDFYGLRAITGPEPKAFLILFALLTLICIAQKRWLAAGICAALTTLSWQPGLMLAAIAFAAALAAPTLASTSEFFRVHPRSSASNFLKALVGFAAPFLVLFFYLVTNDAHTAAWNATIGANVTYFAATQARTPLAEIISANYVEMFSEGEQFCFSPLEHWLVVSGALGFFGILGAQLYAAVRAKRLPINLEHTPLILYTFGFAAFSFIDFDYCPDIFPIYPVLALCVGWLGGQAARVISKATTRWLAPARAQFLVSALLAVLLFGIYILDVRAYRVVGGNFQDQMDVVVAASAYLLPHDHVLSFGDAIVPVTLHLRNSTKILHLGSKSGLGVLANEPGGVQGMIDALDRDPPKLVTLSRENFPEWSQPFYEWLARRYVPGAEFPRANMRILILKQ